MNRTGLATLLSLILIGAGPAAANALVEDEAAYVARCKRETIAAYPGARAQAAAICASKWGEVASAAPIADTLLAIAPAPGKPFDAAAAKKAPALPGGLKMTTSPAPSPGAAISWYAEGEPIPFNLEDALRARGARLEMVGCLSYGAGEGQRVWKVAAPGKAPFGLTVSFRSAALASQSSDFNAAADYSGRLPTLAALGKDGNDWAAACPA